MARTRWRKPPPVQLSSETSTVLIPCYAMQGKAECHPPIPGEDFEMVIVNADRAVMIVPGYMPHSWNFATDAVSAGSGWRVLGWRPLAGQPMRLGELERVDPSMCALERLCEVNRIRTPGEMAAG